MKKKPKGLGSLPIDSPPPRLLGMIVITDSMVFVLVEMTKGDFKTALATPGL